MKELISGVIGAVLTAGVLWLVGVIGTNVVLPAGAIVGVSGQCPKGWVEYDAARGKYILGANGAQFPAGTTGGQNTLPVNAIGQVSTVSSGQAVNTPKLEDYGNPPVGSGGRVDLPFQPSYAALTMCQKR